MNITEFVLKAKANTYAASGEQGGDTILEDGTKQLVFEEGDYKYRDRYIGFDPFIGHELVWHKGEAVWEMNYVGKVFESDVDAHTIFLFLQKAMRLAKEDRPFRGPELFEEGDFRYEDQSQGDFNFFTGMERIYHKDKLVHVVYYHGGTRGKKEE